MGQSFDERMKDALSAVSKVIELHQEFSDFAWRKNNARLLARCTNVIDGLTYTQKMIENHLIKTGAMKRIPVKFYEKPKLNIVRGNGTNSQTSNAVLTVVPKTPK